MPLLVPPGPCDNLLPTRRGPCCPCRNSQQSHTVKQHPPPPRALLPGPGASVEPQERRAPPEVTPRAGPRPQPCSPVFPAAPVTSKGETPTGGRSTKARPVHATELCSAVRRDAAAGTGQPCAKRGRRKAQAPERPDPGGGGAPNGQAAQLSSSTENQTTPTPSPGRPPRPPGTPPRAPSRSPQTLGEPRRAPHLFAQPPSCSGSARPVRRDPGSLSAPRRSRPFGHFRL